MKKIILTIIAITSLACATYAQEKAAASKEPEYRSVDPAKDGFTVSFSSGGSIAWTADGWMSGDISDLTAIGTAGNVKGAKVVLLESGKCVNGKVETKDYGIVKMKSAGGFSADILMTQDSIAKVRAALQKSVTAPTTTGSRASAFRLRVGTDIQFPKADGDISGTVVVDEGKTNFVSDQNIAILLEIGSDYDGKTATLKVKDLTDGKLDESVPIPVKASAGGGISQTFNLHLPAERTRKIWIALELGDLKKETVVEIAPKP